MRLLLCTLLFLVTFSTYADPLSGNKHVYLVSSAGELTHIANVEFTPVDDGVSYSINIIDKPFENQFLSMRPFKCIMGKKQVMCYVPYPYESKRFINKSDLSALSYDLLFLHKNPAEYGINLWNGIFYKLSLTQNGIEGVVHEVDLNIIASPPESGSPPFSESDVFEADVDNYVYPRVLIK